MTKTIKESSHEGLFSFRWSEGEVTLRLGALNDGALTRCDFAEGLPATSPTEPFEEVCRQLQAYFDKDLQRFELPLAPLGTPFQLEVWRTLLTIPYGETTSYGAVARTLGDVKKNRAVGAANGKNPVGIIIPCHRVIGATGALTGYAGGLHNKRKLLRHEGALLL